MYSRAYICGVILSNECFALEIFLAATQTQMKVNWPVTKMVNRPFYSE